MPENETKKAYKLPDFEEKKILFSVPKNDTSVIDVRLMTTTDKKSYVDIREKVTESKTGGFSGYTKKGLTVSVEIAGSLVNQLYPVLNPNGKDEGKPNKPKASK